MSYEYKKQIKDDLKALHEMRKFAEWRAVEMNIDAKYAELDHVYTQADEYEANLNEVKKQLKIKIRHARRDGDYSEAGAFSETLDMIENLI